MRDSISLRWVSLPLASARSSSSIRDAWVIMVCGAFLRGPFSHSTAFHPDALGLSSAEHADEQPVSRAFRHAALSAEWPPVVKKRFLWSVQGAGKRMGGQESRPVDHATRGGTQTGRPRTPPARVCQSCDLITSSC